jgi:membrane protease YdiL (CAAX protease family)
MRAPLRYPEASHRAITKPDHPIMPYVTPAPSEPAPPAPPPVGEAGLPFPDLARRGKNAWWRYLLSILFIAVATVLLQLALWMTATLLDIPIDPDVLGGHGEPGDLGPATFVVLMASIAVVLPATVVAVVLVHRRRAHTLFTARARFDWGACLRSAGVVLASAAVVTAVSWLIWPDEAALVFEPARFFLFLPAILVIVPLQVAAEEVFFRGYFLQGVACLTGRWILRLLVPAAAFAAIHIPNEEFQTGGVWAALDYAVIALYLGYLVLRGNGLEHAIGVHAGINLSFFLIVGYSLTWIQTPSIFLIEHYDFRAGVLGTVALCAIHYGLVMRRLPRSPAPPPR